jgi:AraC family transcriptional activator of pobA
MNENIPIYQLNILTGDRHSFPQLFFSSQKPESSSLRINLPYRSRYYKIAVCQRGTAEVKVNLENYSIKPNSLIIMSPHIIKQWTYISDDYNAVDVFFTEEFLAQGDGPNLNKFSFFEINAQHVFQLPLPEAENISATLKFIRQKAGLSNASPSEMVKNLIVGLLHEMAAIYDEQTSVRTLNTKKQLLAAEFKKLVNIYCAAERNLTFYAAKFFITPKHLTETIKETTGKTAGQWIAEAVVLQAKVLLQNPALTVSQISDALNFPDQSTFGKFFKTRTGLSPSAYKQII